MNSKNKVKVSIVLCTYNGARYLEEQIESLLNQTHKELEIIIVDDSSTDETEKVVQKFLRNKENNILFYKNNFNIGPVAAFIKGLKLTSKSDFYAFCDQDDVWDINKIQNQIQYALKIDANESKPLVIYHDLAVVDDKMNVVAESFWKMRGIDIHKVNFESMLYSNVITGCTCLINNSMRSELILLDSKDIMMHDHWIGLIGYSFGRAYYMDGQYIKYRNHLNTVTVKLRPTNKQRLVNFIKKLKINNNNYLIENIVQADKFYKLYRNKLDNSNVSSILYLISLRRKSPLLRLLRIQNRLKNLLFIR